MNAEGGQSLYVPPPEDEGLSAWHWKLKPGDRVSVLGDDGNEFVAEVKSKPWQLSHGEWVVGLKGRTGGYLLRRVQSVIQPEPTDNQEIEAAELALRGQHTCAWCRLPVAPADRSICEKCWPEAAHGPIGLQTEDPDSRGIAWWQSVAEAKQEERDAAEDRAQSWKNIAARHEHEAARLRAALELLAQVRHVSGNAQSHMRSQLRTIDAVLAGLDVRDVDQLAAAIEGRWQRRGER